MSTTKITKPNNGAQSDDRKRVSITLPEKTWVLGRRLAGIHKRDFSYEIEALIEEEAVRVFTTNK